MVMRLGMIGLSEGNGHPFSFSAIFNGYDQEAFAQAGWPVIQKYLDRQPPSAFGIDSARITHAWTQDPDVTAALCSACRIERAVTAPDEMMGAVDALIVARDDWRSHAALAMPFLNRDVPVFVDKPLTIDGEQLAAFRPHLEAGRLMSTSGFRYAAELDGLRDAPDRIGTWKLVQATVINEMERYGIHMLDAIDGLGCEPISRVRRLDSPHESFAFTLRDGLPVMLDCLGPVGRTFHLSIFGTRDHEHADLHDNFTAFRRTLEKFIGMVRTRVPPIDPRAVLRIVAAVTTARTLAPGESAVIA